VFPNGPRAETRQQSHSVDTLETLGETEQLRALIAEAQDGDVRAFEQLVSTHLQQIRRFARAFAWSDADADDLAQEALVKVYKSLRSFRFQSAFSTWLYAIVRNVLLDSARSRAGKERQLEDPLTASHAGKSDVEDAADEKLAQAEDRKRLWAALRQLPVEFRSTVVLFDIEGHTYEEVAAIEQVAMGTVKSRLSRGRTMLRDLLSGGRADGREQRSEGAGTLPTPISSQLRRSEK
jgi:RNA polymerase sigma-70 factor, ECF subfamily